MAYISGSNSSPMCGEAGRRSFFFSKRIFTSIFVLMLACGCASPRSTPNEGAGTVLGALTGAVLGHQIDHDHGALFGAAIGAIAGSSIARYQDEQQIALEQALLQERRNRDIAIRRLQDETLQVSLSSDACFDFDKAEIKPAFYRALDNLADELTRYNKTILHVIGHTDTTGSPEYNYALSIRRAEAVAQYLVFRGVCSVRIRIQGRGEQQPRTDNDTSRSRRLNRRVEIFIKPIVEGRENESLNFSSRTGRNSVTSYKQRRVR